ncbi:GrpB-like predicted nucleotidyltransferase (UPF0157 family) [Geomicrobium halophilum]|uniref:GrpB-like predicted nucleotidyltransferase (UPF0157 family) n=1 Tax=Geomicrobium halophilum TaxID=549000 RepID=A0A841PH65_9BACL|nr:GrpB family protein [Geomicrobium halophilum]MBB6448089.1 GrpB-like predicted nucleotidyltransferase (UPF0157 family) [Geomicrobium halophilum]
MQDNSTFKSDQALQKVTLGECKPHNAPITLLEYDSRWPKLFDKEANRIRSVLSNKALQVKHVGSTSVPGMCAKPIIDILLVVMDSADETNYVQDLEQAGYINLHVFSKGASEVDRMLRFRDWLRANKYDRDNYARVKRDLAQRNWRRVQHYADAKKLDRTGNHGKSKRSGVDDLLKGRAERDKQMILKRSS